MVIRKAKPIATAINAGSRLFIPAANMIETRDSVIQRSKKVKLNYLHALIVLVSYTTLCPLRVTLHK